MKKLAVGGAAMLGVVIVLLAGVPIAAACTPDLVPIISCDPTIVLEFGFIPVLVPACTITAVCVGCCSSGVVLDVVQPFEFAH